MVDILKRLPVVLQERVTSLTSRMRRQRQGEGVQVVVPPFVPNIDTTIAYPQPVEVPQYENRRTPEQEFVLQRLLARMHSIGSGEDEAVGRLSNDETQKGVMASANAVATVLGWYQEWGDTPNYISMVLQHQDRYSTTGAFFVNLLVHPHEIGTTYHREYDDAESRTLLPLRDYPGFGIEVAKYNVNKTWGYYDPNYAREYTLRGMAEEKSV